ncbi:MAG: NUDIX domain-containing protein [Burkholderiales bacterium]
MADNQHLIETLISSKTIFTGNFLHLLEDQVKLPDGKEAVREYIKHPGAVAIIPITATGEIVLEYQYRHPIGQVILEIPAGKLDDNEPEIAAAKRELLEETGYSATKWTWLGKIFPCIGYSNEQIIYYLAEELSLSQPCLDEGEFVEVYTMPVAQCFELAYSGQITDGKTIAGLMLYQGYLNRPMK